MDTGTIFAGIIFGSIGVVAFIYGKKQSEWRPMVIGLALIAYPYFVSHAILQWAIGAVLTLALFVWRA
ncbi:MAG: amino acid transport protein [Candidatus Omnitrophota bacterium]